MDRTLTFALIYNVGLLLIMGLIYDVMVAKRLERWGRFREILLGLGVSTIGIVLMMMTWELAPGINFDARSILLSLAGLFFGPIPTAIAVISTMILRLLQGGAGAATGVGVIITSGFIGVIWRNFRRGGLESISLLEFYLFGLIIHINMLALMFLLPFEVAVQVLADISIPVLIVFPLGSTLLARLLQGRLIRERALQGVREANLRLNENLRELERMQEHLLHQERLSAVGQLAGSVAHDFNNQLMTVLGYAELLDQDSGDEKLTESQKEYVDAIREAAEKSRSLTRQLLAISNKVETTRTPVDLRELLKETIGLLHKMVDPRIVIDSRIDDVAAGGYAYVMGDSTLLQNALINLGQNAKESMPSGGTVRFGLASRRVEEPEVLEISGSTLVSGEYLVISVTDDGVGISDELLSRIFQPFFTTKPEGGGVGMGLAAVLSTAKKHGGGVSVKLKRDSDGVSQGTTFSLYLPRMSEEQRVLLELEGVRSKEESRTQKERTGVLQLSSLEDKRILVVDDEQLIRLIVGRILAKYGAKQIAYAENGLRAIEMIHEQHACFDLIIMDLVMPGMHGRQVYDVLRQEYPTLPVIIISGHIDTVEMEALLHDGVSAFLEKPIQEKEFIDSVIRAFTHAIIEW